LKISELKVGDKVEVYQKISYKRGARLTKKLGTICGIQDKTILVKTENYNIAVNQYHLITNEAIIKRVNYVN